MTEMLLHCKGRLGESIIDSLKLSKGVSIDYGELAIDSIIENDILRDIPVVKTVVGLYNAVGSISNRLLLRKILKFLSFIEKISDEEINKFRKQLDSDEKAKIGEQILLYLDKHENLQKAELLAIVFSAYIRNKIDIEQFYKLSDCIHRLYVSNLPSFLKFKAASMKSQDDFQRLFLSGLLKLDIQVRSRSLHDPKTALYRLSELGETFSKLLSNTKVIIS